MNNKCLNESIESRQEKNRRARLTAALRSQKIKKFAEPLMILIGVIGQSLFYLQAYKIYSVGSAADVSAMGFFFALFSLVSWFIYGFIITDKVLIFVNAFAIVGASLTLLSIFLVS